MDGIFCRVSGLVQQKIPADTRSARAAEFGVMCIQLIEILMKSKIFIASSVEGLSVAYSIQTNLQYDVDATVWPQGVFNLSETPLDSLAEVLKYSDFGIFVFTPDDVTIMRDTHKNVVRDNVLFELGLFIGKLGKQRCYIVAPNEPKVELPTDLLGQNIATYDSSRSDLSASLGPACHQIRLSVNKFGPVIGENQEKKNIPIYEYDNYDESDKLAILDAWLKTNVTGIAIKFKDIDKELELEPGTSKEYLPLVISQRQNFHIDRCGDNIIKIKYQRPRQISSVGIW